MKKLKRTACIVQTNTKRNEFERKCTIPAKQILRTYDSFQKAAYISFGVSDVVFSQPLTYERSAFLFVFLSLQRQPLPQHCFVIRLMLTFHDKSCFNRGSQHNSPTPVRSPRVPTRFSPLMHAIFIRAVIGLRLVVQFYPHIQPLYDFYPSGQSFAVGFLLIHSLPRHPFHWLYPSHYRMDQRLHPLEHAPAGRT